MLHRLRAEVDAASDRAKLATGLMAAAARSELDSASSSLMRVLGSGPEPTRVEPFTRQPKPAAEGTEPAEEELHSVIAPGYFEEDFDAVRLLLEGLPADSFRPGSSARFARHIAEESTWYEAALDRVTHELSANVMANYGTFVTGMAQIFELGSDLILTGMRAKAARRNLRAADSALSRTGLTLIGLLRRRAAMRLIAARLEGITGAVRAAGRLQVLLSAELCENAEFAPPLALLIEASGLYATCRAAKASAGEGSLLLRLKVIAELDAAYARLLTLLDEAHRRLCARFETHAYAQTLECAVLLDTLDDLASSTADVFASAIS
mmetsp:Transcript_24118/g.55782  ORF Transcript_24118/g.55782 Transcript_24118/m.55782 type:complete len:323 (-) Transcript_24118:835-1803(-)